MTRYVVRTLAGTLLDYPTAISTKTNYVVRISGVDVFCVAGNLKVDLSIGKRSQATVMIHTDTYTHFQQYERISILDNNGNLIFNGYITGEQEQQIGFQQALIHKITAVDQHFLADKRIIAGIYTNKTCGAIVVDLVRRVLSEEGVTIGVVYDGLLPSSTLYPSPTLFPNGNIGAIPSITFAYCTVAQALDQLVTLASSGGTPYFWTIDATKKLFFVPYTAFPNVNVVDGTTIWQDGSTDLCSVQRQNPKYRNVEWLTGGVSQTPTQTEVFLGGDGRTSWTLNYQVASTPLILLSTQGLGQNLQQIVGLKGTTGSEYYWTPGDATISQDTNQPKLQSTQTLKIIYTGQFPSVVTTQNNPQIVTQAQLDGTSGKIEVVDEDKNLTNANSAVLEASQLLTQYSVSGTLLTFTTLSPLYSPGDLITVNLPNHNLNNTQMLVESVSISDQRDNYNMWYSVTAILGPYDNTWQAFFSKLLTTSHANDNITVGSSSTAPTAPTLVLYDAAMRFRLQLSGGGVHTSVFKDAMMRFRLQSQTTGSTTQSLSMSSHVSITVTPTVTGGGTGGGGSNKLLLYSFSDNTNTDPNNLAANKYCAGANILLYWTQLEPTSEGTFDWSPLETPLNHWSSHGKKCIVRISVSGQKGWHAPYSGQGTPSWVFNAGVQKIISGGDGTIIPQYWNSTFQAKLKNFINAVANQYDGDSRIAGFQIAVGMGGECKTDSEKYATKLSVMQAAGYTDVLWFQYIQFVMNAYLGAFTRSQLMMASDTDVIGSTSGYSQDTTIGYITAQKGKIWIQNDGLVVNQPIRTALAAAMKVLPTVSEQRNNTAKSGDTMAQDLAIAKTQASSKIFLVFQTDLNNSANNSLFDQYAQTF